MVAASASRSDRSAPGWRSGGHACTRSHSRCANNPATEEAASPSLPPYTSRPLTQAASAGGRLGSGVFKKAAQTLAASAMPHTIRADCGTVLTRPDTAASVQVCHRAERDGQQPPAHTGTCHCKLERAGGRRPVSLPLAAVTVARRGTVRAPRRARACDGAFSVAVDEAARAGVVATNSIAGRHIFATTSCALQCSVPMMQPS
jgi:hypothetical protein